MNTEDSCEALPFRDDFAARVLLAADQAMARRRRIGWAAAGVAASVMTALAIAAPWRSAPSIPSVRPNRSQVVASAEPAAASFASSAGGTQTDPLVYMFPDAEPLARFSTSYANDTSGEDTDIFSDESEEASGS